MTAPRDAGDSVQSKSLAYKDKSKPTDVRQSNINAAKGKESNKIHKISITF